MLNLFCVALYVCCTGNSNHSIEAAHEVGMQCVAVAARTPVYELTAADLVVRQLEEVSFVNLKQLFRMENTVSPHVSPMLMCNTAVYGAATAWVAM